MDSLIVVSDPQPPPCLSSPINNTGKKLKTAPAGGTFCSFYWLSEHPNGLFWSGKALTLPRVVLELACSLTDSNFPTGPSQWWTASLARKIAWETEGSWNTPSQVSVRALLVRSSLVFKCVGSTKSCYLTYNTWMWNLQYIIQPIGLI